MDWKQITEELEKPLDKKHVHPPKQYGPKGDYIEGWHAIAEANRIFGFNGWSYQVLSVQAVSEKPRKLGREQKDGWGVSYVAQVVVTVADTTRHDVGAGHGYDADLGLAHESASKEAVTDALKRALRTFGNPFGLALYDKTREYVADTSSIAREVGKIATITDMEELRIYWQVLVDKQPDVARAPEVIDAKDERKAAILKEQKDKAA